MMLLLKSSSLKNEELNCATDELLVLVCNLQHKAAFTESPYLLICANTDMRIKNTHIRIKFLLSLVCFKLPFTEHA